MFSIGSANLVRHLEEILPPDSGCQTVEMRRRDNSPVDVRFFFKDRAWLAGAEARALLDGISADPCVEDARLKGNAFSLRFSDDFIDDLGLRIEAGENAGFFAPILSGSRYMVGFAGPNTSKALHIGHLRNISIGNALASALAAAGADVVRQSLVGDIGRNICEAMAGYRLYHDGVDPVAAGIKPDRFFGECYARFIREHSSPTTSGGDPIERELSNTGDPADKFMQGWLAGDPETLELWARTREWVMSGHHETLTRFGVTIDRHDFESEAMADVPAIMEEGVRLGVLEREPNGTIVYRSGREEFEALILVRDDGFPTEHARLLAVYFRLLGERSPGDTYIDLAGTEWQPASAMHMELMAKIRPERPNIGHVQLFHSMVTLKNSKVSSSAGDAVLIDDLLDRLVALPEVLQTSDRSGGVVRPDSVADIVVKSFFLCRPHMKLMEYSWDLLVQPDNPGWTVARAWCHAMAPDDPVGEPAPPAALDADLYRLLVLRSQEYQRNLEAAATEFNLAGLTSYLVHYCEDYLRLPTHPRMKRLARAVLGRCLASLGLN